MSSNKGSTVHPMPPVSQVAPTYAAVQPAQPAYPMAYPPQSQQPAYPPPAYPAESTHMHPPSQQQQQQQHQQQYYQHHQPQNGQMHQYPGQQPVVVIQQPTVTVVNAGMPRFHQSPVWLVCPHCQNNVQTTVYYKVGGFTFLIAAALFIFGLSLGCCLIPFCMNSCKDAEHICPNCNRMVGKFNRL